MEGSLVRIHHCAALRCGPDDGRCLGQCLRVQPRDHTDPARAAVAPCLAYLFRSGGRAMAQNVDGVAKQKLAVLWHGTAVAVIWVQGCE